MEKMKSFYKNKKVLVTGATGFKGAWLCAWLLKLGAKVYGTGYNPNQNKSLFYKLSLEKKINLKIFDTLEVKFDPIIIGYFSVLVIIFSLVCFINIYNFIYYFTFSKIITLYLI